MDAVADWNWKGYEDKSLEVSAYSSCDEVGLFLNDKSPGKKPTNRSTQYMASWQVPYQPGKLKAVGYKGKNKLLFLNYRLQKNPPKLSSQPTGHKFRPTGRI